MISVFGPKLFVEVFLVVYFLSVLKLKKISSIYLFGYIIAILACRDILYHFINNDTIISLSHLVVISIYLIWLRTYTGKRKIDQFYFIANGLFILLIIVNTIYKFVPITQFHVNLWLIADIIYLFIFLGLVSEYNTENAEIILQTRFIIIAVLLLFNLITLLFGYSGPIIQNILFPLFYFLHTYILYRYNNQFTEEGKRTSSFYSTSLESMFEFMKNLGQAIMAKIDLPKVMDIIVTSAVKNIGADAGAILIVDEFEDILTVRATCGIYPPPYPVPDIAGVKTSSLKSYFSKTPIKIGETILGEAVKNGEPILVRNAIQDERMKYNTSNDIFFVSSVIAIPLIVSNRVIGVLSTLKRVENQFFDDSDFSRLKTFADYASMTIENIFTYLEVLEKRDMDREVSIAAEIQKKLLPGKLPKLESASLAVLTRPARGVSGDYYDIIRLNRDKIAIVICDVAGKGVPAALVMVMIRSILHLIVSSDKEASKILTWINRGITGRIEIDHFATIGFLVFNQRNREVVYSNAAHYPLLVYRSQTGKLAQVDTEGLPIGIERTARYGQKRFNLHKGDIVILYTDGIIEAMNSDGRQYSLSSLINVIKKNSSLPSKELVEKIRLDLQGFVGNTRQHDDQTLLMMKAN